jgi:hypothetical protein
MKTLFNLLFVFFLLPISACQTSWFTELATAQGERLFWDDFSDTSGNWPEYFQDDGSMGTVDGAYRILVTNTRYQLWAVSGQAFGDVQVEVDIFRLAGPQENFSGLICRYQDENNFYFFIISSDGYYTLGKVQEGQFALIGQEMMAFTSYIQQGEVINHLRFDCIGSTLTGFINDQMVAITEDANFQEGDTGLTAGSFDQGGVEIRFDDFVVIKP